MKWRILTLCLLLLLGAIANVAVAWACVCWVNFYQPDRVEEPCPSQWPREVPESFPAPRRAFSSQGFGSKAMYTEGPSPNDARRGADEQIVYLSGWPALALWSVNIRDGDSGWSQMGGIEIPQWLKRHAVLPMRKLPSRPLWPGFAINTGFYAAMLWMAFAFSLALRRFIQRQRRQCVLCGYDLRGQIAGDSASIVCPECGDAGNPKT